MEVFRDSFSLFGESFRKCLDSLDMVFTRREESNLVMSWEKFHFMVKEGIVGHKISRKELEVDQAKIEVIKKLAPSVKIKE